MFSLVALKTAILDQGIPGMSPLDTALAFLLMFGIPMIPYAILYLSLRQRPNAAEAAGAAHGPFAKMTAWMHAHRHPQLLHH